LIRPVTFNMMFKSISDSLGSNLLAIENQILIISTPKSAIPLRLRRPQSQNCRTQDLKLQKNAPKYTQKISYNIEYEVKWDDALAG